MKNNNTMKFRLPFYLLMTLALQNSFADDGYKLWLKFDKINDPVLLKTYSASITGLMVNQSTPVMSTAAMELKTGLTGLLGKDIPIVNALKNDGTIIAGTPSLIPLINKLLPSGRMQKLNNEGFTIYSTIYKRRKVTIIASATDRGVLYGVFHYLRLLQTGSEISSLDIVSNPAVMHRILNHWDNLNRSVERGYAGLSIWDWEKLPLEDDNRYTDYARANASIGINGTVITNVNANARVLTPEYLVKVAALADKFRPYGIRIYLTARFSAPVETGGLKTADPLDPEVRKWWKDKVDEIYRLIPDFGGFTVKANSEGQPGPQNYGRSHAEGANMLAEAVKPYNGIVMWRAFVYDNNVPVDRAMQAYNEFVPLDGKFLDNVLIQVKNGPVDFQPREPFHPLFGGMKKTPVMPEFQITQEYLGASVHLVYLGPLFEECLKSDTYALGKGSTVARVIDGKLYGNSLTAMAGVANIGSVRNWTGHLFGQANWYAFGRLAWDPSASSADIAADWIKMTFNTGKEEQSSILKLMMKSRETAVSYMTPLGLHHIMYSGHHYGPGPWVSRGRQDWTSVYYHKADTAGIGFNRSSTGSNAVSQYFPEVRDVYDNIGTCPENLLLWFHHVPWDHKMKSGRSLWDEICIKYQNGLDSVRLMQQVWANLKGKIDEQQYMLVDSLLKMQVRDAKIWHNGCLLYFQTFSGKPFPEGVEKPENDLKFYINYRYRDVPGIR